MYEIDQKQIVLEYLKNAYTGANMCDDEEMKLRLFRAIIAFTCDDLEGLPTWDEMWEEYMLKDGI